MADLLGAGWPFPILPDATGALALVAGEANVEQSLKILLLTQLGERVMRPDFGSAAPRLVFAPGSRQFLSRLETSVRAAVRDFEPRIDLDAVDADAEPGEENRVTVSIAYRVRASNSRFNLVFPFYLDTVERS
ncbi:MAG TPA: GPW/gp25 family protein [Thermoanaerobaculia bacterium]|jgi:phage baseplate assembly protein W|nr:GPW/gp25 family protein [Thermoanaerobaculia bacterium]